METVTEVAAAEVGATHPLEFGELFLRGERCEGVVRMGIDHFLDDFFRFWSQKTPNVIIQKYNYFSGLLANKQSVDLAPLQRNACWH